MGSMDGYVFTTVTYDLGIHPRTSMRGLTNAAFIRTGDYRISQFTTREERSFEAEVRVIMDNIP